MNAPAAIHHDTRSRLTTARDVALRAMATMPDGLPRRLHECIAVAANEAQNAAMPAAALEDTLTLCRMLMRAQNLAGMLDGTYPTDRYGGAG